MKQVNWASARKYCADRNAQLVAIANEEEQKALTLYLKKQAKGAHSTRRIPFVINYGPVYLSLSQYCGVLYRNGLTHRSRFRMKTSTLCHKEIRTSLDTYTVLHTYIHRVTLKKEPHIFCS